MPTGRGFFGVNYTGAPLKTSGECKNPKSPKMGYSWGSHSPNFWSLFLPKLDHFRTFLADRKTGEGRAIFLILKVILINYFLGGLLLILNILPLSGWTTHSHEHSLSNQQQSINSANSFTLRNRQLPCNKRKYASKACNTYKRDNTHINHETPTVNW